MVARHGDVYRAKCLRHAFARVRVEDGQQVEVTALGGEVATDVGAVQVQPLEPGTEHGLDLGGQPGQHDLRRRRLTPSHAEVPAQ